MLTRGCYSWSTRIAVETAGIPGTGNPAQKELKVVAVARRMEGQLKGGLDCWTAGLLVAVGPHRFIRMLSELEVASVLREHVL